MGSPWRVRVVDACLPQSRVASPTDQAHGDAPTLNPEVGTPPGLFLGTKPRFSSPTRPWLVRKVVKAWPLSAVCKVFFVQRPSIWQKLALIAVVIIPLAAVGYAIYELWNKLVGPTDLALLIVLYTLTTLGIGIGFHRMLTHKAFEAPAPIRFIFLALGSMALEGPAISWAATHTKHHAKADREGDPHSPLEGFWHAHVGWLFSHGQNVEEIYHRGFKDDKVAVFISKTFAFWAVLGFVIPFAIGGWSGLVWGGLVRVFFNHHVTWSVNSICHTFGRQPYETPDRSRNEWVVGLLALGEGWHNNHHAFPRAAFHGLKWYQFDLSAYIIRVMAWLRLVRNVWVVRKGQLMDRIAAREPRTPPVERIV
jgi:stearoyl-CoA desaturase (Delta-9 desaturase)